MSAVSGQEGWMESLSWGILYHMLGLDADSQEMLEKVASQGKPPLEFSRLRRAIRKFAELQARVGFLVPGSPHEDLKRWKKDQVKVRYLLFGMVRQLGRILDPAAGANESAPRLAFECRAIRNPVPGSPKTREGQEPGYSRDPFKPVVAENTKDEIALAAACYLLRGHALFFCRPRDRRDFNAAKTALNDFHQAYQLAWRLYHNLDCSHHSWESRGHGLDYYFTDVLRDAGRSSRPSRSPYFAWSVLLLCAALRGNIYQQIDYVEEAERHYRHAEARFNRVYEERRPQLIARTPEHSGHERSRVVVTLGRLKRQLRQWLGFLIWNDGAKRRSADDRPDIAHWFVTPTLVRALFQRSRVQFSLGQCVECLLTQTRCLEYVVRLSDCSDREARKHLLEKFEWIRLFLEAERALPVCDRDRITWHFGDPCAKPEGWLPPSGSGAERNERSSEKRHQSQALTPRDLTCCIGEQDAFFVAHVLARMGFVLDSLRRRLAVSGGDDTDRRGDAESTSARTEWLLDFFRFDERVWNTDVPEDRRIRPPNVGYYYGETRLAGKAAEARLDVFRNQLERRYALLLRLDRASEPTRRSGLKEEDFYRAMFQTATENIESPGTIPRRNRSLLMRRGYRYRRDEGDLSQDTVFGGVKAALGKMAKEGEAASSGTKSHRKLVVLRRWQSFNPKIPRPSNRQLRGGGYLLLWRRRGIVIDPGYDFIQNLYDEGFSLEDIDAVIVTHSHPDHDDDLSNLTTLVKEWNEYHEHTGQQNLARKLDLFLNESSHKKFSSWLQASEVRIGRIVPLAASCWDKDSERWEDGPFRGDNVRIDLCGLRHSTGKGDRHGVWSPLPEGAYGMEIEVVPAWHDDVIGKTAAVGLKFHLCDETGEPVGIIGYTGDTGAYGLRFAAVKQDLRTGPRGQVGKIEWESEAKRQSEASASMIRIVDQYRDCDVLVSHLGDIRLREIDSLLRSRETSAGGDLHPLTGLLHEWFLDMGGEEDFRNRVRHFLQFLIGLELAPSLAFRARIRCSDGVVRAVQEWLGEYLSKPQEAFPDKNCWFADGVNAIENALRSVLLKMRVSDRRVNTIARQIRDAEDLCRIGLGLGLRDQAAFLLLSFLVLCAQAPWQYEYHLGIFGVYKLFEAMVQSSTKRNRLGRVFIVGELPEELASYRHMVARWLNATRISTMDEAGKRAVHAFTGDIGLHIGLDVKNGQIEPQIRCTYCNYNNELVCKLKNYHAPGMIRETALRRRQGAMIYLCTERDHYPEGEENPRHFLSRPELRLI